MAELLRPPDAVLLGLDGPLVETERLWQRAYRVWAHARGVPLPSGWWAEVAGTSPEGGIGVLAPDRSPLERADGAQQLVDLAVHLLVDDAGGADLASWRPGARTFVAGLDAAGVATAVVTSAPRDLLDALVDHLGIEVLVTVARDEVSRGTPDPEGYLRAAEELEVPPAGCVVVADSPVGIEAAESAGMRVLAVPSAAPVEATPTRRVLAGLTGVDLGVLAALPAPMGPADH